jgi:hypothetical protein
MTASRWRGPARRTAKSPWGGSMMDVGNSIWGARNLQTGSPANSFVSVRTHKSSLLSTASTRSAYHHIANGLRTLRQVRVAPIADIGVATPSLGALHWRRGVHEPSVNVARSCRILVRSIFHIFRNAGRCATVSTILRQIDIHASSKLIQTNIAQASRGWTSTSSRLQLLNFPSSACASFQTRSVTAEPDSARASAAD